MKHEAIRVLLTGAAGQVAESLLLLLASGSAFGPRQPIILHLYDLPHTIDLLEGMAMELIDLAYPTLQEVVVTLMPEEAFRDISLVILAGATPRKYNMTRSNLIEVNVPIFCDYGQWLNDYALKTCKVVVLANPPNTLTYICMQNAPTIPRENFVAATRLDQNRTVSMLAAHLGVSSAAIKNVINWGNHSETGYPDASHASVTINNVTRRVTEVMGDDNHYIRVHLIPQVVNRGNQIIETRQVSSSISASKATCDLIRDWWLGTPPGRLTSMSVLSDGAYGSPKDVFFSLPVEISGGCWNIPRGIKLDDFSKAKIEVTGKELLQEVADAWETIEKELRRRSAERSERERAAEAEAEAAAEAAAAAAEAAAAEAAAIAAMNAEASADDAAANSAAAGGAAAGGTAAGSAAAGSAAAGSAAAGSAAAGGAAADGAAAGGAATDAEGEGKSETKVKGVVIGEVHVATLPNVAEE